MKRQQGIIEWAMHYYQITLLVLTVLVGLGIYGLVNMPKQEFPEFTIRQGVVVGVYPGATSAEVEEQLAKPLERYLYTFKEIKKKKTYSMSRDGMVYIMVELNDEVNNKDEVWSKIKLGLQNFKSQLPSGVLAVIANDDFGDTSALLITLESEDKTYRELEDYLESLEDRLRRIESVSNLRRYGIQKEQISVYLDRDKLTAYKLDTRMLMTTLFTQGFTTSGGSLKSEDLDIPIHFSNTYASEKEIADQIILADGDGNIIRLKDIARIVREYPEPDSYIMNNGKKAIILSMEMREGNNIVQYGKEVDKVLAAFQEELPESVSIQRIADQPKVVDDSVSSFVRDLFVSIVVVILVMMLLFPFKSAIVAATSIPISIFISIGIMSVSYTHLFGKEAYVLTGYLNVPKILEVTLHNGVDPVSGRKVGLETGNPCDFAGYDDLYAAFMKQVHYFVDMKVRVSNYIDRMFAQYAPATFLSLFIDDCIAKGRDYYNCGPRYNTTYIQCTGLGTITDSLSSLKKHVFEDKRFSMDEMLKVMADNFAGAEVMRQTILNRTPFFGNDDEYADAIAVKVFDDLYDAIEGKPNTKGECFHLNMLSTTCHVYFGKVMGATPNGRLAEKAISDGTSPSHGADTHGPSAVIKSLGKLDQVKSGGTLLNQRFLPSLLKREEDISKLASLIRSYFALGGHHIQFNIVDTETLYAAQKCPEDYRDLLVRVAGYSDYFNDMNADLQADVIARTEQESF